MRAIAAFVVTARLAAGSAPALAKEPTPAWQQVDVCLSVRAPLDAELATPEEVEDGIAFGDITVAEVFACGRRPTGTSGGLAPFASAPAALDASAWIVGDIEADPASGQPTAFAYLEAESGTGRSGEPFGLTISCIDSVTDVLVFWDEYLGVIPYRSVLLRMRTIRDGGHLDHLRAERRGVLPADARDLIEALYGETRLLVRTTPDDEATLTAVFAVEGIEETVRNVHEACGW